MCDTIAGELLLSFHKDDAAGISLIESIQHEKVPHVEIIEELSERLRYSELPMRKGIRFKFYRLRVPAGEEAWKVGYLQFFYKAAVFSALQHGKLDQEIFGWSNNHLQVVPNSILSLRAAAPTSSIGFSFTPTHSNYKKLLGVSSSAVPTAAKRVLMLDTGIDPSSSCVVRKSYNFVDHHAQADVTDDHGHGTAVAEVINDMCKDIELDVFKVADASGRASEWDTLAALAANSGAEVVNISLAFGLEDRTCRACGRESRSSRSAVFENLLLDLDEDPSGPLIVAAAGNDGLLELAFPARFGSVLAISSVNSLRELSEFSNHSTVNHEGKPHTQVFLLPGGEKPQALDPTEFVGQSASGEEYWGTSFSAAYASGLIASLWSDPTHIGKSPSEMVSHLCSNSDRSQPSYNARDHGNGLMRYQ